MVNVTTLSIPPPEGTNFMSTSAAAPARTASAHDTPRRGLLKAAGTTAAVATAANLAIWAITDALVDVPERFTPLQPGSIVFMTLLGVALAAGFLRLLAGRTDRPAETFRRIVPVALVLSLIPDIGIWASGAYEGAAEAQTVLPLMAMHVLAAAAVLQILPTAFPRRSK
jgi:hypothetical protein